MGELHSFLKGGGKMGKLIREAAWEKTSLGSIDNWPESLKSAVAISINSGFPIAIYWGSDFTLLYNDAWSSIPGEKHPWALGKPGAIVWPEIWKGLEDQFNSVLTTGESIRQPDALLLMERYGYREECFFDYTLSPIIATDGSIGGVFNAVIETTYKVINERRSNILSQFLTKLNSARTIEQTMDQLRAILKGTKEDIPFSLINFSTDETTTFSDFGNPLPTPSINWPIHSLENYGSYYIHDLSLYSSTPILSPHGEACTEALIVPLAFNESKVTGYMILGISPRKRLDTEYRRFLETVGLHAGTMLNNAYSWQQDAILEREQTLNEELAAANEELNVVNEELYQTQQSLITLNDELEERIKIRTEALADSEARFRRMIEQAPAAMAIFRGEQFIIEVANPPALTLAGKTSEIIGKPVLDVLPEIKDQPAYNILCDVYTTGKPFSGFEVPVILNRFGQMDECYFNISYTPLIEDNKITGVLQVSTNVTEQVLLRQNIEEREMNLRSIVQTSPYAMMLLKGNEWEIDLANQQIANLWNKPLTEIVGKTLMEVLPELEGQPFPDLLRKVYETGEPYGQEEEEFYVNTADGLEKKYISFYYNPLLGANNEVTGIIVSANDITSLVESRRLLEASHEEQQALNEEVSATNEELIASNEEILATNEELAKTQQELQKNLIQLADQQARLRFMLADAPVAIALLIGPDLIIESANDKILELWGKNKNVIGLPLSVALPELEGQPFIDILLNVYTSGTPYYGNEAKALLKRNHLLEECYFNFVYHPLKNQQGESYSIMVVATDVSEQVKARKQVEESEKRFKFMLNAIPQQVWTANPDGILNYVNAVVCNDFGYDTDEVVGQGWQKFIHPDDLPGCIERWSTSLKTGRNYLYEFRLRMRNGDYVWHLAQAIPYYEGNTIKLWLGTSTNIDLQKKNDQKKDEFLSIASHELKTPLTSIKAFNQLIQRSKDLNKSNGFAQKSAEHIFRLEKLINDLLDVTKINAGKLVYNMEPFNFGQMLQNSIESVQHMTPSHKLILEKSEDIEFLGDQLRLEQVMHNFLTNAVKYSPDADKVIVRFETQQENIIVSVQDFGIGIGQDHLDRLFERYYRVDNTAMRFEGLGLGLFISSEILKRHKGSFWIESEEGKGSTFYFRLPLFPDNEPVAIVKTGIYYEDNSITVAYNARERRLDVDWKGFHTLESVQKGCLKMLEILRFNRCSKILNDNRNILGTWSEAAEWVGKQWFPMMEEAGLKYFAWIFSNSSFSQLSAKKSVNVKEGKVITRFFTDAASGMAWLEECAANTSLAVEELETDEDEITKL